jgi:hypothetical protein
VSLTVVLTMVVLVVSDSVALVTEEVKLLECVIVMPVVRVVVGVVPDVGDMPVVDELSEVEVEVTEAVKVVDVSVFEVLLVAVGVLVVLLVMIGKDEEDDVKVAVHVDWVLVVMVLMQ